MYERSVYYVLFQVDSLWIRIGFWWGVEYIGEDMKIFK